tara:strand:- start:10662 stop:11201 length:540 start_codon:yes stop_codon:yes gene_type:complete
MKIKIGSYPKHRWYHNFLYETLGFNNEPKVSVRIDNYDTWSMDHTLAYIIIPMLKQLKETKQGAPYVYPEDVPAKLRPTKKELTAYTTKGDVDSKFFERWEWVMDQMIFAFESKHEDWEEQFTSGEHDIQWIDLDNGMSEMIEGPNHTYEIDWEGRTAYQERVSNGFKLFGKYYEGLWD